MDGVAGLEMARRGCRDCDGHRGREVSWLVRYVGAASAASRARTRSRARVPMGSDGRM